MQYNVDYFIQKFEAIPESKWCRGAFFYEDSCCANGHCGINVMGTFYPTIESDTLSFLFETMKLTNRFSGTPLQEPSDSCSTHVANINDGRTREYQQPTPKQRILAALYDIKAKQNPPIVTVTKEVIKYVAVAETIREMEVVNN